MSDEWKWMDGDYLAIGKASPPDSLLIPEGRLEPMGTGIDLDEIALVIPRRVLIDIAREILRNEDIN